MLAHCTQKLLGPAAWRATIGLMKKLDFIFFDAGGGHRAAANGLRQVMEQQGRPFEIRMVNLQELLDAIDIFRKITGLRLQDVYNVCPEAWLDAGVGDR